MSFFCRRSGKRSFLQKDGKKLVLWKDERLCGRKQSEPQRGKGCRGRFYLRAFVSCLSVVDNLADVFYLVVFSSAPLSSLAPSLKVSCYFSI